MDRKTMGGGDADITTALSALNEAKSADLALLDDFSGFLTSTIKE